MGTNQLPAGINSFISKNDFRIELILAFIAITSMVFLYLDIPSANIFLAISFSTLSVFYFLLAFTVYEEPVNSIFTIIANKAVNIGSSVSILGILYKLLKLPGANNMLYIGIFSIVIAAITLISTSINNWTNKKTVILIRITLITITGLILQ